MKNQRIVICFLLTILLQSCYSYKSIDLKNNNLSQNKEYKINRDGTFFRAKIIDSNDSIIKLKVDGVEKQISKSEIKEIKEKKFSALKTVSLIPIAYGVGTIIAIITAISRL